MAEAPFAGHDVDGNGKWDFEEIRQFLRAPSADVTATVRFGKRAEGEPLLAFEHGEPLTSEVRSAIGSLNLGTVQMEFSAVREATEIPEEVLKRQFKSADADNNGYLDEPEFQRVGQPGQLLGELDRDKDGKLFPEELVATMAPIVGAASRQINLTITDGGRDMFRILDSTGDGRLSVREFRAMADRAALWDRDDDGRIALAEVPQQYRLSTAWGRGDLFGVGSAAVAVASGAVTPAAPRTQTGPVWFQRMDRNGDGDLSRREFLGTPEDFQKLDKNADALISPDEAR
jgi:Ca2+-binding EF-hand superfamily protein